MTLNLYISGFRNKGDFPFSKPCTTNLFFDVSREYSVLHVLEKYCGGENMHKKKRVISTFEILPVKSLLDRQAAVQRLQVFRYWELSEVNLSAGDWAAKKTCVALFL